MGVNLNYCLKCQYFWNEDYCFFPNTITCTALIDVPENEYDSRNVVVGILKEDSKEFSLDFKYPHNCPYSLEQVISTEEENNKSLDDYYQQHLLKPRIF